MMMAIRNALPLAATTAEGSFKIVDVAVVSDDPPRPISTRDGGGGIVVIDSA
nr:hypothetical protein [Rhodopirellula sp. SM50]